MVSSMRGKALTIIGILLTLSGSTRLLQAEQSIAQEAVPAMENVLLDGTNAASEHGARYARIPVMKNKTVALKPSAVPVTQAPSTPVFPAVIDQPDIQLKHKIIATEVFDLLPAECHDTLKHFYVRYEKPDRRGLAGKSTVIVDGTLPDDEFRAVLIHEMLGHVFDLGCKTGSADAGASMFKDGSDPVYNNDPSAAFYRISWTDAKTRRTDAQSADFVSGYAVSDPFEDLAESMTYYLLQRSAFFARAQLNPALAVKLKWLQTFFATSGRVAAGQSTGIGAVPWDTTKLPYRWSRSATVAQGNTKAE